MPKLSNNCLFSCEPKTTSGWRALRESRTARRKIFDDLNTHMKSNKPVEKCMKKIKYLIERHKEAKEWNRKQTEGSKKKSLFYDAIDVILGC